MIELMFAAALSGMRTGEAVEQDRLLAIGYRLVPSKYYEKPEPDWRKRVGSDSSFEDARDCPVFFSKELPGLGTVRLNSACTKTKDDELWP